MFKEVRDTSITHTITHRIKEGLVQYISHGLTTYTFFFTSETRPIKSNLTCDTKNLIYMIQRNRCYLQYIGETKRRLKRPI